MSALTKLSTWLYIFISRVALYQCVRLVLFRRSIHTRGHIQCSSLDIFRVQRVSYTSRWHGLLGTCMGKWRLQNSIIIFSRYAFLEISKHKNFIFLEIWSYIWALFMEMRLCFNFDGNKRHNLSKFVKLTSKLRFMHVQK